MSKILQVSQDFATFYQLFMIKTFQHVYKLYCITSSSSNNFLPAEICISEISLLSLEAKRNVFSGKSYFRAAWFAKLF